MLQVGQELWFVPADGRYVAQSCPVQVKSVGRKWANISREGYRIDIGTLWVDGGKYSSPGRCWPSKEAWEFEERRKAAWGELYRDLYARHSPPPGVTIEDMDNAAKLLGLRLNG